MSEPITEGRFPDDEGRRLPFAVLFRTHNHAIIRPAGGRRLMVAEDAAPLAFPVEPGAEAAVLVPFAFRVADPAPPGVGGPLRPRCPDCGTPAGLTCPTPLPRPCPRGR